MILTKIAKKSPSSLGGAMNWQGLADCATALIFCYILA
jgi:hypothetical protein